LLVLAGLSAGAGAKTLPMDQAFQTPPTRSPNAFLAYYNPKRATEFVNGNHAIEVDQQVAIRLYRSLDRNLKAFFKMHPNGAQMRRLLEIPLKFGRGQLHEQPSGPIVLNTELKAAEMAVREARNAHDLAQVLSFQTLNTAQFEHIKSWLLVSNASRVLEMAPSVPELYRLVTDNYYPILNQTSEANVALKFVGRLFPVHPHDNPNEWLPAGSVKMPTADQRARIALQMLSEPKESWYDNHYLYPGGIWGPNEKRLRQIGRTGHRFVAKELLSALQDGAHLTLDAATAAKVTEQLRGTGLELDLGETGPWPVALQATSIRETSIWERCLGPLAFLSKSARRIKN
jgi:hypothetical protein